MKKTMDDGRNYTHFDKLKRNSYHAGASPAASTDTLTISNMKVRNQKTFKNGIVYCLELPDGMLVETTDTFLPYYTKDAIGRKQNFLDNSNLGNRTERWMIGVSTMSGCPVRCKFCATGNMKLGLVISNAGSEWFDSTVRHIK